MSNPFSLEDKVVLITGASSGIGRGIAQALSNLGARLILTGRREEELQKTLSSCANPASHIVRSFDVTDTLAAKKAIQESVKEMGASLSGFVHSAGVSMTIPIRAITPDNLHAILSPNLVAAMLLMQVVTSRGVVNPSGASVVLISSVAGIAGCPGLTAYSASKGALLSLARSAAAELAPKNIRVNCIAPGYVQTPMHMQARENLPPESYEALQAKHLLGIGEVEDVAYAAAYLLSDAARRVTGTTLVVDGGYSL